MRSEEMGFSERRQRDFWRLHFRIVNCIGGMVTYKNQFVATQEEGALQPYARLKPVSLVLVRAYFGFGVSFPCALNQATFSSELRPRSSRCTAIAWDGTSRSVKVPHIKTDSGLVGWFHLPVSDCEQVFQSAIPNPNPQSLVPSLKRLCADWPPGRRRLRLRRHNARALHKQNGIRRGGPLSIGTASVTASESIIFRLPPASPPRPC